MSQRARHKASKEVQELQVNLQLRGNQPLTGEQTVAVQRAIVNAMDTYMNKNLSWGYAFGSEVTTKNQERQFASVCLGYLDQPDNRLFLVAIETKGFLQLKIIEKKDTSRPIALAHLRPCNVKEIFDITVEAVGEFLKH